MRWERRQSPPQPQRYRVSNSKEIFPGKGRQTGISSEAGEKAKEEFREAEATGAGMKKI